MEFKNIIYINGKSGLFEIAGNRSNGVIAKSIADGSTQFYSSRIYQFTPLNSIEMYTHDENIALGKIMQTAKDKLAEFPIPTSTDDKILRAYFKNILPNYDEERVKMSDIKKFVKWFDICKDMDFSIDETIATEE